MQSFSDRLREQMARRNLNQQRLAQLIGVTQGSVSRWLKGSQPHHRHIEVLAKHLGVTFKWLLSGRVDAFEGMNVGDYIAEMRSGLLARWGTAIKTMEELRIKELPESDRGEIEAMLDKAKSRYRMLLGTVHILEGEDPSASLFSNGWEKPPKFENLLPVILENKTPDPLDKCSDLASLEKYAYTTVGMWLDGLSHIQARDFLREVLFQGEVLIEKLKPPRNSASLDPHLIKKGSGTVYKAVRRNVRKEKVQSK
jgi:transcriptional regulator with XRE-family HTH domain